MDPLSWSPSTSSLTDTQRWALTLASAAGWGVVAEERTTAVQLCRGSPPRGLVMYLREVAHEPDDGTAAATQGAAPTA